MTARILILRDGDAPAATVERVLARDYAELHVVPDWQAAEAALVNGSFDLAVIGGAASGAAALPYVAQIRAQFLLEALPLIFAVQVLTPAAAVAAYRAGADAVIGPHPDTVLLGARVRHLLRHQNLVEELRLRERTTESLGLTLSTVEIDAAPLPRRLLMLTDDGRADPALTQTLTKAGFAVSVDVARPVGAVVPLGEAPELVLVDVANTDPLAIAARFRRIDRRRTVAVAHETRDPFRAVRALELGLAEPLPRPLDPELTAAALARMAARQSTVEGLRRQYQRSIDLAVTDSLTGVFNRRYLDAYFAEKGRAEPAGAFALLLIDVDRFKEINDRLGHASGDAALRQIAQRLLSHVRTSDMVVRMGGEEFAILMPGADCDTAAAVAERLRSVVAERPFTVEGDALKVTVSIGIAGGVLGPKPDGLLADADVALYASKRKGRNCVTAASAAAELPFVVPAA